jgi:hypothetical protein
LAFGGGDGRGRQPGVSVPQGGAARSRPAAAAELRRLCATKSRGLWGAQVAGGTFFRPRSSRRPGSVGLDCCGGGGVGLDGEVDEDEFFGEGEGGDGVEQSARLDAGLGGGVGEPVGAREHRFEVLDLERLERPAGGEEGHGRLVERRRQAQAGVVVLEQSAVALDEAVQHRGAAEDAAAAQRPRAAALEEGEVAGTELDGGGLGCHRSGVLVALGAGAREAAGERVARGLGDPWAQGVERLGFHGSSRLGILGSVVEEEWLGNGRMGRVRWVRPRRRRLDGGRAEAAVGGVSRRAGAAEPVR